MSSSTRSSMTAADVMTANPRTCSPFSTVLEAVLIFRDADCGAVPVVAAGEPVGILTDRDVAVALAEHPDLASRAVADFMTRGAVTVAPGDPIEVVAAKFDTEQLCRLLVVDSSRVLRGIIARSDLAAYLPGPAAGRPTAEVDSPMPSGCDDLATHYSPAPMTSKED